MDEDFFMDTNISIHRNKMPLPQALIVLRKQITFWGSTTLVRQFLIKTINIFEEGTIIYIFRDTKICSKEAGRMGLNKETFEALHSHLGI